MDDFLQRDNIRRIAQEARLKVMADTYGLWTDLEQFAKLVAKQAVKAEREACAKVCEDMRADTPMGNHPRTEALFYAAKNIRARTLD